MNGEKVIHLDAADANYIRKELLDVRKRLLEEQSEDSAPRLRRLSYLIDSLVVPEPPPA